MMRRSKFVTFNVIVIVTCKNASLTKSRSLVDLRFLSRPYHVFAVDFKSRSDGCPSEERLTFHGATAARRADQRYLQPVLGRTGRCPYKTGRRFGPVVKLKRFRRHFRQTDHRDGRRGTHVCAGCDTGTYVGRRSGGSDHCRLLLVQPSAAWRHDTCAGRPRGNDDRVVVAGAPGRAAGAARGPAARLPAVPRPAATRDARRRGGAVRWPRVPTVGRVPSVRRRQSHRRSATTRQSLRQSATRKTANVHHQTGQPQSLVPPLLLLLLLLAMNLIRVALSHYCCRTTLQCQCHEQCAVMHVRLAMCQWHN